MKKYLIIVTTIFAIISFILGNTLIMVSGEENEKYYIVIIRISKFSLEILCGKLRRCIITQTWIFGNIFMKLKK